jgi:hypothetical protein
MASKTYLPQKVVYLKQLLSGAAAVTECPLKDDVESLKQRVQTLEETSMLTVSTGGLPPPLVFETDDAFRAEVDKPEFHAEVGQVVLIKEKGVPDYWCSGITDNGSVVFTELEATAAGTDVANKAYVDQKVTEVSLASLNTLGLYPCVQYLSPDSGASIPIGGPGGAISTNDDTFNGLKIYSTSWTPPFPIKGSYVLYGAFFINCKFKAREIHLDGSISELERNSGASADKYEGSSNGNEVSNITIDAGKTGKLVTHIMLHFNVYGGKHKGAVYIKGVPTVTWASM